MIRFNPLLAVVLLSGGTVFCQSAAAQSSMPQNSGISPWMGLWSGNTGALDNYHTFVRPQLDLDRTLQIQGAALNRQAAGLRELNYEITQPQRNQSGMVQTGQGASFMTYSHYYSNGTNRQISRPPIRRPAAPASLGLPALPGLQ